MLRKASFLWVMLLPIQANHAVSLDTSGNAAQALIVPYYTVNNGFESFITIKNNKNDYKALKVRIRDSKFGLDILDFNVFVPPNADFELIIRPQDGGGAVASYNNSLCSLPKFPPSPPYEVGLRGEIYNTLVPADESEGYVEIIEMGVIESSSLKTELSQGNCESLFELGYDGSSSFHTNGIFTKGGAASNNGFYGSTKPDGLLPPSGGLQGSVILNNADNKESYTIDAIGIADYSAKAQYYFSSDENFYLLPSLASGSNTFSSKSWSTISDFGFNNTELAPRAGVASGINPYPLTDVLAKTELTIEYFVDADKKIATDWIITNPMRVHNIFRNASYSINATLTGVNDTTNSVNFSPSRSGNKILGRAVNVLTFSVGGAETSIFNSDNQTTVLLDSGYATGTLALSIDYNFLGNNSGAPLIATAITRNRNLVTDTIDTGDTGDTEDTEDTEDTGDTGVTEGFVEGKIYDACNGKPLGFVDLQIGSSRKQQTDENGDYKIKLSSGSYTIKIAESGYDSDSRSITVKADQTRYVVFPLAPPKGCNAAKGASSYKAVVVAGTGPLLFDESNFVWPATQALADKAYKALKLQGFGDNNIYYLSANPKALNHDADNDGKNDVDAIANVENLSYALTEWAKGVEDVVVYFIGHGAIDSFNLDRYTRISASDLDSDLDTLQTKITGKLTVVFDACNSGSFLSSLRADKRYVIASTGRNLKAIISGTNGNGSFSYSFWDEVVFSGSLVESFRKAKEAVSRYAVGGGKRQKATLDANASGSESARDYDVISEYCFGLCNHVASAAPIIDSVSSQSNLQGQLSSSFTLEATVNNKISRAWATVQRPDLDDYLPTDGSAITQLPQIELQCKGSVCEGEYDNFNIDDSYTFTFYLEDDQGSISQPRSLEIVQNGRTTQERNAKAVYEPVTGLLTLKDVQVAGQHYYVELKDEGDFKFGLSYLQPLTAAIQKNPSVFDGRVVVIPSVLAFDKFYSVDLKMVGSLFNVDNVKPAK